MKAKDGQRPLDLIGFKNYTRQSSRETGEVDIIAGVAQSRFGTGTVEVFDHAG